MQLIQVLTFMHNCQGAINQKNLIQDDYDL